MERSKSFESTLEENNNESSANFNEIETFGELKLEYHITEGSDKQPCVTHRNSCYRRERITSFESTLEDQISEERTSNLGHFSEKSAKVCDVEKCVELESNTEYRSTERSGRQLCERMKSREEQYEDAIDDKPDDFNNGKSYVKSSLRPGFNRAPCKHVARIISVESALENEINEEQTSNLGEDFSEKSAKINDIEKPESSGEHRNVTYSNSNKCLERITSLESSLENEINEEQKEDPKSE